MMLPLGETATAWSALRRQPISAPGLCVSFVGSYPPRECGIATFTADTLAAVRKADPAGRQAVAAVTEPGGDYTYPSEVRWVIDREIDRSYDVAAAGINASDCQIVNVQHEYGLFGGECGSVLLRFLDQLRLPVVLTLHTVLPNPERSLRFVTRALIRRSMRTIVLARTAIDILERDYGVEPTRLRFVPHGVPDVPFSTQDDAKRALGFEGRTVLSTCGLMNRGKGIEYAVEAIAGLVGCFPDLLYVVAGETHPGVRAHEGETYRQELRQQVIRLGLEKHVHFEDRYLSYRDLVLHLLATDVYVVPYLNLNQIVSGTLAYAVGCGRAVVSTPSAYARELLSEGRGVLVEARQPAALRAEIARLLDDEALRRAIERRAYTLGQTMTWPRVAQGYLETFDEVVRPQAVTVENVVAPGLHDDALPSAGAPGGRWSLPASLDITSGDARSTGGVQ